MNEDMKEFRVLTKKMVLNENQKGNYYFRWSCKGYDNQEYSGVAFMDVVLAGEGVPVVISAVSGDDLSKGGWNYKEEFWLCDYDYIVEACAYDFQDPEDLSEFQSLI